MSATSSHKRTSIVWTYFQRIDDIRAKCTLCGILIVCRCTTSSLRNHLIYKHPSIEMNCKGTKRRWRESTPIKTDDAMTESPQQSPSDKGRYNSNYIQRRKSMLPDLKDNTPAVSVEDWKEITQSIVEFCALDLKPISVVSGEGFQNMVERLNPTYKVPSTKQIKEHIEQLYATSKQEFIASLKGTQSFSFSIDEWTSVDENYTTVTIHYIDSGWVCHHRVLNTFKINKLQADKNHADKFTNGLQDFSIDEDKVLSVTTNTTTQLYTSLAEKGYPKIKCFGQSLQISVYVGFSLTFMIKTISSVRQVISYLNKCTDASTVLEKQKELELPTQELTLDNFNHWLSTYFMMKTFLEQRQVVQALLVISPNPSLTISDEDWRILEEIVPILEPLQLSTVLARTDVYPMSSLIYPLVNGLLNIHLKTKYTDSAEVQEFKDKVGKELSKIYFAMSDEDLCRHPCVIASALDPRYKQLKFLNQTQKQHTWFVILEFLTLIQVKMMKDKTNNASETPEKQAKSSLQFLLGEYCDSDIDEQLPNISKSACKIEINLRANIAMSNELDFYKGEKSSIMSPTSTEPFDALQWWKYHSLRFPTISKLARKYLGIPGTSVPSERIFSAAGDEVVRNRASLDPDSIDQLIFIREKLMQNKAMQL